MTVGLATTASLDVGQVLRCLRDMKSGIDANTESLRRFNSTSDNTRKKLQDNFRNAGSVANRAGGPVGSFTGKILSAGSMDGMFSRMAAGVALGAAAIRAYSAVVDMAVERARLFINAQNEIRQTVEKANQALDAQAKNGEAQAPQRFALIAAGGENASRDADMVASIGTASPEESVKGVTMLYERFGDTPRAKKAVDMAMRGSMAGLSFTDVASQLTKMGNAIDDTDNVDHVLGRMVQEKTGRRGDPKEIMRERLRNVQADEYLTKARDSQAKRSEITKLERDRFMQRDTVSKEISEAKDPLSGLQLENFKKLNDTMDELKKLAEAQGPVLGFMANIFKPEGSFETQMKRLSIANAQANGLPTKDSTPTPVPQNHWMSIYPGPQIAPFGR